MNNMNKVIAVYTTVMLLTGCSSLDYDCSPGKCYKTNLLLTEKADSVAVYPMVLIKDESKNDTALLEHEITHLHQQKEKGVIEWLWLYWRDKSFRLDQEVEAYKIAIDYGMDIEVAIDHLTENYGFDDEYNREYFKTLLEQ